MSSHQDWEEIAAGHALGALEPDDEQRFEAHLRTCAECRQVLIDTEAVMAELALEPEQLAPPPELKSRLLAAIHDADAEPRMMAVSSPDTLEIIRRRRSARAALSAHWVRLSAAASVILLAIIAAGVWSLHSGNAQQDPQFVALQTTSKADMATVELLGDRAWVIPTAMPDNDSSNSIYVLWAVPAHGAPVAVSGFDVEAGHAAIEAGHVRQTLNSVAAFAISKEPGRSVPTAPSDVLGSGKVSWPVTDSFRTFD